MNYLDILHAQLGFDEGVRAFPYADAIGKMTIGCGRNLTDDGVNRGEIALMFDNDLAKAEETCRKLVPNFDAIGDVRKSVVMNMAFQLGYEELSLFHNTLAAIIAGRWNDAAVAMMASKVAQTQAPARWARLSDSMRYDIWKETT